MKSEACQQRFAHVRLGEGGRIVIPADFRTALGAQVGDKLVLRLDGSEVRVFTHDEALRRVQEMVGRYNQDGRLWSDELIAERRAEAARE
jgi:bifunctional DNA-binding transcriptional regulator/antitoxin component of YhaV-PrlF toxin-antitoxin module